MAVAALVAAWAQAEALVMGWTQKVSELLLLAAVVQVAGIPVDRGVERVSA